MTYSLTLPNPVKKGWENSPLQDLPNCTPQFKGKVGTILLLQFFETCGIDCKAISDEGDLLIGEGESQVKAEVKTALVSYQFPKSGEPNETYWWNQIRPLQKGWDLLYLVGVSPVSISIWEFTREKALLLAQETGGLEHTGQGKEKGLLAVQVEKKKRKNTFPLLTEHGVLTASIQVNDLKITTK
jgi:hypothetical protein